jgi:hypothetical protein
MVKTERSATRTLAHLVAGGALMLLIGSTGRPEAQGPGPAPAQGQPPGPAAGRGQPPGGGRGIRLPQQGFEVTGQSPGSYTPAEAAAVAVVVKWIETTASHDLAAHMALIDDNIVFRPDPTSALRRGAREYCGAYGFVRSNTSVIKLDELFVVGGPSETLVLIKRTDINNPAGAGREGALDGYQVSLHVFARVNRNGKITEWYDSPLNKVSGAAVRGVGALPALALPQPGQAAPPRNVPAVCMSYPEGSAGAAAQAQAPPPPQPQAQAARAQVPAPVPVVTYGTSKPEFWFNPFEAAAALAVRGWFASWKAGDPLLLAAFVDQQVIFRGNSAADLGQGRDNLLKQTCGYIGGRADLASLFVIGGDFDAGVLTRWDAYDAAGTRTRMGSFFRVRNGLVMEWMDSAVDGISPATRANPNSPACQAVNAALASRTGGAPPANQNE